MIGLTLICWAVLLFQQSKQAPQPIVFSEADQEVFGLVENDALPETPGPVVVKDSKGQTRWTISIPRGNKLPLSPAEYSKLCTRSEEIAQSIMHMRNHKSKSKGSNQRGYYHVDPNFIDIAEAQEEGLLPAESEGDFAMVDVDDTNHVVGGDRYMTEYRDAAQCQKTLTFVLQTEDGGLGKTLMHLWMSYGLAKKEGREFFIDDSNWSYGKFTTYFKPPTTPSCRPPPASHRIPYPHHARHLLVSSATSNWAFGQKFVDQFENSRRSGAEGQKDVFKFMHAGYKALFHLTGEDREYYDYRVNELRSSIPKGGGPLVGVHVRHGDCHPLEFQYEKSYIPLHAYSEAANDLVISSHSKKSWTKLTQSQYEATSSTIVASDDPDVYASTEMKGVNKAQTFISLVSKADLDPVVDEESLTGGFENEDEAIEIQIPTSDANMGWEGGFYNDIFWSLGIDPPIPAADGSPSASQGESSVFPPHRVREESEVDGMRFQPTSDALALRELVGRAYLLDLAVLGQSDAVVCGISSVTCRLLGVMLGWDKAISDGGWRNVDGSYPWRAIL